MLLPRLHYGFVLHGLSGAILACTLCISCSHLRATSNNPAWYVFDRTNKKPLHEYDLQQVYHYKFKQVLSPARYPAARN